MSAEDIFAIPVADRVLIYAPLHAVSALVNRAAYEEFRTSFAPGGRNAACVVPILSAIYGTVPFRPEKRTGPLKEPLFLGILPTRGCGMGCRYCDFPGGNHQVMPLSVAKNAVDAYLMLLSDHSIDHGAIHFFGGEPFDAPDVVQFTVEYARLAANSKKIDLHFEAVTNGLYPKSTAAWISQNIDSVVLSFDGLPAAQNTLRPYRNGTPSFDTVFANAVIFSRGGCDLVIRSCISQTNIETLADWAGFILENLDPSAVCLEPMIETPVSRANNLSAAGIRDFVRGFVSAADLLSQNAVPAVYSTAETRLLKTAACPLGQDALIVTPEGNVNACYQVERQWVALGLDFRLGRVTEDGFGIPAGRVEEMRKHHVDEKPLCSNCFCRYHCAGGCPLVHPTGSPAGQYDEYCMQTRMITAASLLTELGQVELRDRWLTDDSSFAGIIASPTDRVNPGFNGSAG